MVFISNIVSANLQPFTLQYRHKGYRTYPHSDSSSLPRNAQSRATLTDYTMPENLFDKLPELGSENEGGG
jgi:hypothetical protein